MAISKPSNSNLFGNSVEDLLRYTLKQSKDPYSEEALAASDAAEEEIIARRKKRKPDPYSEEALAASDAAEEEIIARRAKGEYADVSKPALQRSLRDAVNAKVSSAPAEQIDMPTGLPPIDETAAYEGLRNLKVPKASSETYDKFFAEADANKKEATRAINEIMAQDAAIERAKNNPPSPLWGVPDRVSETLLSLFDNITMPIAKKSWQTQEAIKEMVAERRKESAPAEKEKAPPSAPAKAAKTEYLPSSSAETGFDFEGLDTSIAPLEKRYRMKSSGDTVVQTPDAQISKPAPQISEEDMLTDFRVATGTRFNPNSSADKKYMEVLKIFRSSNPDLSPSKLAMQVYKEQGSQRPEIFAQQYLSERTQEGSLKEPNKTGVSNDLAREFKVITGTSFNPKSSADSAYMARIKQFRDANPDLSTNQLARLIYRSK